LHNEAPADEPFIGSADIQSPRRPANSFSVIQGMRIVPFELRTISSVMLTLIAMIRCCRSPLRVFPARRRPEGTHADSDLSNSRFT
jgi:hypothetical protein